MSVLLSDAAIRILRDLGYNITRSFSSDISPLEILDKSSQQNVFEVIGDAEELFYTPKATPVINKDLATVDISGTSKTNLSISLTLSFLENFLQNTIVSKADITAAFKDISTLTTTFSDCSIDVIFLTETWKFLKKSSQGGINEHVPITSRILDNTSINNPAYIVTETLKAKKITISAQNQHGITITPNIQILKIILANGICDYTVTDNGDISIKNSIPQVFAFKACPLWINSQVISLAPPDSMPNPNDVSISYFAFSEPSSLHNSEILTPVLLTNSGMPVRISTGKK
jgi:hypothetical protein